MKNNNLNSLIRIHNIRKLFVPLILIIICTALLFINPMDKNLKAVQVDSLDEIHELYNKDSAYIQYHADKLYYSGIDYVAKGRVAARIYYTIQDDYCYLFILSCDSLPKDYSVLTNRNVTARLIKNPAMYERTIESMSSSLKFSPDNLKDICENVFVSQYNASHSFSKIYTAALLAIIALLALHVIYIVVITIIPTISRYALLLRRYGNRMELYNLACSQLANAPMDFGKGLFLTDDFIIKIDPAYINIIPIENIVWVYNYNDLKHTGRRMSVRLPMCIVTDIRKIYKISHVPVSSYKKIISIILNKHPEIMVGYEK